MINSFGFQTELAEKSERIVRSTFDLKLNGYIIPNVVQKDMNAIKKFSNKSKIIFGIEATTNPLIFEGNVVGDRIITEDPSDRESQKRTTLVP